MYKYNTANGIRNYNIYHTFTIVVIIIIIAPIHHNNHYYFYYYYYYIIIGYALIMIIIFFFMYNTKLMNSNIYYRLSPILTPHNNNFFCARFHLLHYFDNNRFLIKLI